MAGTDFAGLDPETRAFALVGRYLHSWSAMESVLHDCIQTAFRLTPTMRHIICANLRVHDKANILRTVVHVVDVDKRKYGKLLRRVGEYASRRNTVAHNQFQADADGAGVEFTVIKAKGTYEANNLLWTEHRFEQENCLIGGVKDGLNELNTALQSALIKDESLIPAALAASLSWQQWLSDWYVPMQRTTSPALLHSLSQPVPAHPDSGLTTQGTVPQTPDKP